MKMYLKNISAWVLSLFLFVGVTTSGFSNTLCIGDETGIEAINIACNIEQDECCKVEKSLYSFDECEKCIDLSLDAPLLFQRDKKIDSHIFLDKTIQTEFNNIQSLFSFKQKEISFKKLQYNNNLKVFSKIISSTVLLC